MQSKSDKKSEFSTRTEDLARNLGVKLSDLPKILGVSASMFFAYRSGKHPISNKAWRKLDQAERECRESVGSPFSGKELCFFRIRSGLSPSDCANFFGLGLEEYSEIEQGMKPIPDERAFWSNLARFIGTIYGEIPHTTSETAASEARKADEWEGLYETAFLSLEEGNEDAALDLAIRILNDYKTNRHQVLNLFKASSLVKSMGHARLGIPLERLPSLP